MSALKVPQPVIRFLRKFLRPEILGVHEDFIKGALHMQKFLKVNVEKRGVEDFDKFFYTNEEMLDMAPQDRLMTVYEHLEYQIRDLLVHIHDVDNMQKAAKPICSATDEPYTFAYPGFQLRKIQHTVSPMGGEGVFVEGCIEEGQLIGFYPGLVFKDHDAWLLNYGTDEPSDMWDPMLITRHDATVCDGATNIGSWRSTVEGQHMLSHPDLVNSQECGSLPNPYAMMQLVPHPPQGTLPNCFQLPYDLEKDVLHSSLLPYIPNQIFPEKEQLQQVQLDHRFNTDDSHLVMKMFVYIATRRIENEELFVDFRMDPDCPCPDWYWVVDPKALRRRYKKTGIGGRVRGWWKRRQSTRWEVYKEVMKDRRNNDLDDLPEGLGGTPGRKV